jgi:hypothetical protein
MFYRDYHGSPGRVGNDWLQGYPGKEKDYAAKERLAMCGPMTALIERRNC